MVRSVAAIVVAVVGINSGPSGGDASDDTSGGVVDGAPARLFSV